MRNLNGENNDIKYKKNVTVYNGKSLVIIFFVKNILKTFVFLN